MVDVNVNTGIMRVGFLEEFNVCQFLKKDLCEVNNVHYVHMYAYALYIIFVYFNTLPVFQSK